MLEPYEKDALLRHIVETVKFGEYKTFHRSETVEGFTDTALHLIFKDFEQKEFINYFPTKDTLTVQILPSAYDFLRRGGFQFEERLFQDTVEKLYYELEKLQREESKALSPKTNTKITEVLQATAALIEIMKSFNS